MTQSKGNAICRWIASPEAAMHQATFTVKCYRNILWISEFMNLFYLKEETKWATP